ncbi:MAG TPA: tetratricopeptide repeat protein [Polyangiaceae bacterium]|nr:tetratricopeptide repeat protein [Polyangiaceae bacterium]
MRLSEGRARASACVLALCLTACGGGAGSAESRTPDPPLDDGDANAVQEPSSAAVKRGIDLIQKKDFEGAKKLLSAARAKHPQDPQAAFYLGVALENLGDGAAAKEHYGKALELDPRLSEASVNLSALLLEGEDAAGALRVADGGLRFASRHPELLTNRALALEAAGNTDEAVKAYAAALAASPGNVELGYAYAELLAESGRKEQALDELKKLAQSDDPRVTEAVANLFGKLGAFNECIAVLDAALKKKPRAELFVRRGVCRHELDDETGAKGDFEAALEQNAEFAPAHYYLGMHYRHKGDKKQATAHLTRAVEHGKNMAVGQAAEKALNELKAGKK